MTKMLASLVVALLSVMFPCFAQGEEVNEQNVPIGVAEMLPDGTITLHLRAETEDDLVGDAFFEYKPDDPDYEKVKKRIGGIEIGQEKFVYPVFE